MKKKTTCAGFLPVQFGSLHQGVGIPVFDHHLAAQAHKALGVILVFSGHLETHTRRAALQSVPSTRGREERCADGDAVV